MVHTFTKYVSLTFSAGVFGAIVNTLALVLAGRLEVLSALSVQIPYELPLPAVYSRVVWGGLWGFLFLVPFAWRSYPVRGLIYSIGPTLAQLFYFFPAKGAGVMGLGFGELTPAVVVALNAVWGVATALWLSSAEDRIDRDWLRKSYME